MSIVELLILVFGTIGIVNIIIYSPAGAIFNKPANWIFKLVGKEKLGKYLLTCPTCLGFWVGMFSLSMFLLGWIWVLMPFALSFCCYLAALYVLPEED